MQNCTRFIGISNHKFDYEPIFVFVKPPNPIPYGIVNAGQSRARAFGDCRFHKTEVRMRDYIERDRIEYLVLSKHHLLLSIHLAEIQV
jgi:hypothetical protein